MISLLLPLLAALPAARAWGDLGHETVAYIAQNFVNSATAEWAQSVLGTSSSSYLAGVATWADTYRYTSEGTWSQPLHFIDAEDNPPSSCNVDYDRDCGASGCSVSAIANYTQQLLSSSTSSSEQETALKFVIHFLGDITQPLHDEAYEYGANDVYVTYDGDSTDLHAIWDTNMPETLRDTTSSSLSVAQSWASNLTSEIKNGIYTSEAQSWLDGLNINDPVTSAMGWATDANAFVCSVVMPNGAQALENESDLYPSYYNSVIDTLELQIAKGGYRLAAWLNDIAAAVNSNSKVRRSFVSDEMSMLNGIEFLPPYRPMSEHQLRRLAVGYGCNHKH